ncbi:hypothetical protein Taro_044816 [Colocasia esculenta]|uniref:Two-component response regulator-like PRR95 n=1 Tax=Colocasia esculenta TaxID=4460 RepID=A0A843X1J8_COLES|nr:hypothetical protein [Colocasia esculenta]
MEGGEGERAAAREGQGGGGAGAGPSSLAVAEGGAAGAGSQRGRPGAAASLHQQQRRRVIRWERFLPRRSLRVLLVEQDDSTRHIVTALLRKCSYRVAAVADGLKAWDILKEKNYIFDLVLSEVEVPSLSGISLLCKIMSNELSKNIPVIMMSSHDSVSVVFRCMQKGAVDFLVKPVRKNELRNLWQHVWRRHCSTSFANATENMLNNQTVSENMSDNNAASNNVSANAGKGFRNGESCDGGDDQSLGSKPPMQNESSKEQGMVLHFDNRNSTIVTSQSQQLDDDVATLANPTKNHDDDKAKDMSVAIEVSLSVQETAVCVKVQQQTRFHDKSPCKGEDLRCTGRKECLDADRRPFWQSVVPHKTPEGIIDFIGSVVNGQCNFSAMDNDSERENALCEARRSSNIINMCPAESLPSWELSLRRQLPNGCVKNGFQEKNILNHSAASAFSRYAHTGISIQGHKSGSSSATRDTKTREHVGMSHSQFNRHESQNERPTPSVPDGRSEPSRGNKEEAKTYCQISSSDDDDEALASVPSGEDKCTGYSATKNHVAFPHPRLEVMSLPIPVGAVPFQNFCSGYGPILQPMFYHQPTVSPHGSAVVEQAKCFTSSKQHTDYTNHVNADIQSRAFHSCEEDCHPSLLELRKDDTVDTEQGDARRPRLHACGSEENTEQSGSCNWDIANDGGSNGNGGTSDAAINMRTAFECSNEDGLQICRGKGVDPHHSHREAALIKFRLKRKDRCFEKKVRYHSRKMLAEQRPRVKGQFVRQAAIESTTTATEMDD